MNNPLISFMNFVPVGSSGAGLGDTTKHEPPMPRVALGIAAIALAVVTFTISVIVPAQTTPWHRDSRVLEASESAPSVPKDLVSLASITVVAARDPGSRAIVGESSAVQ